MKNTTLLLILTAASSSAAKIDISTGQATSEGYIDPFWNINVPNRNRQGNLQGSVRVDKPRFLGGGAFRGPLYFERRLRQQFDDRLSRWDY